MLPDKNECSYRQNRKKVKKKGWKYSRMKILVGFLCCCFFHVVWMSMNQENDIHNTKKNTTLDCHFFLIFILFSSKFHIHTFVFFFKKNFKCIVLLFSCLSLYFRSIIEIHNICILFFSLV